MNTNEFNNNFLNTLQPNYKETQICKIISKYYLLAYINASYDNKIFSLDEILKSRNINEEIDNVFLNIEKEIPNLKGVFTILNQSISDEILYKLLIDIKATNFDKDQWKDAFEGIIHYIYESLYKGKEKKGLDLLATKLMEPFEGSFYDGTSGLNGLLIKANEFAYEKDIYLFGQEVDPILWAIGKIRLFINGVTNAEIKLGNTISNPLFIEHGDLKRFDNIVMELPNRCAWKEEDISKETGFNRFVYGKPSRSDSSWLFISHVIKSLREKGKAIIITGTSPLFKGLSDKKVREKIILSDFIESVILLPGNSLVDVSLIVINMNKEENLKNKILFINANNLNKDFKTKCNVNYEEYIKDIVSIYKGKLQIDEISEVIDINELDDANLLPSRYVMKLETYVKDFGKVSFNKEKMKELNKNIKLKDIGTFYRGINITKDNVESECGQYKIINLADVQEGQINMDSLKSYHIKNNARVEAYKVSEGDIIMSIRGAGNKVSIIPKHEGEVLISQNFVGIKLNRGVSSEYIKEYLESPLVQLIISSKQLGSSISVINTADLKDIPVVLPSNEEQVKIINDYNSKKSDLEEKIKSIQQELKNVQFELYNNMEIGHIFNIKND